MGKSKNTNGNIKNKNHIFKVAGCKSLKAKYKAKAVTNERTKSIRLKNQQKVEDIDKQLSMLNTEVRQSEKPNVKEDFQSAKSDRTVERQEKIHRYNEAEMNYETSLGKLNAMDML